MCMGVGVSGRPACRNRQAWWVWPARWLATPTLKDEVHTPVADQASSGKLLRSVVDRFVNLPS